MPQTSRDRAGKSGCCPAAPCSRAQSTWTAKEPSGWGAARPTSYTTRARSTPSRPTPAPRPPRTPSACCRAGSDGRRAAKAGPDRSSSRARALQARARSAGGPSASSRLVAQAASARSRQNLQVSRRMPAADLATAPPHRGGGRHPCLFAEQGLTMIELLIASVAAVTVLGATLGLMVSGLNGQTRDSEWSLALQEDRAGLARMVRDLRQATSIEEANAGSVVFLATIGGKSMKIKYECGVA